MTERAGGLSHCAALVLIPPAEVWEPIEAVRRMYDPKIRRWMPHITLAYPFLPPERFGEAADAMEGPCAARDEFTVTFRRFGAFPRNRGDSILWLAPEPADAMANMRSALAGVLEPLRPGLFGYRSFEPHLTVGRFKKRGELRAAMDELASRWQPLVCAIGRVCLIERENRPDARFEISRSIPLGRLKSDEPLA